MLLMQPPITSISSNFHDANIQISKVALGEIKSCESVHESIRQIIQSDLNDNIYHEKIFSYYWKAIKCCRKVKHMEGILEYCEILLSCINRLFGNVFIANQKPFLDPYKHALLSMKATISTKLQSSESLTRTHFDLQTRLEHDLQHWQVILELLETSKQLYFVFYGQDHKNSLLATYKANELLQLIENIKQILQK